jgi:hypothetical protein
MPYRTRLYAARRPVCSTSDEFQCPPPPTDHPCIHAIAWDVASDIIIAGLQAYKVALHPSLSTHHQLCTPLAAKMSFNLTTFMTSLSVFVSAVVSATSGTPSSCAPGLTQMCCFNLESSVGFYCQQPNAAFPCVPADNLLPLCCKTFDLTPRGVSTIKNCASFVCLLEKPFTLVHRLRMCSRGSLAGPGGAVRNRT